MKKSIIVFTLIILVASIMFSFIIGHNTVNHNALIIQAEKVTDIKTEAGPFFYNPFVQEIIPIYIGEQSFTDSITTVTSDSKPVIIDYFVTWRITDPEKYYKIYGSKILAEFTMKNDFFIVIHETINSLSQSEIVDLDFGSLEEKIQRNISISDPAINVFTMGIENIHFLDRADIYDQMIENYNDVADSLRYNGEMDSKEIINRVDSIAKRLLSEAESSVVQTKSEGEQEYIRILSHAYYSSKRREDFYNFLRSLDSIKKLLSDGGSVTIYKDSPIYQLLLDAI